MMKGIHNGRVSSGSSSSRARTRATIAANRQPSAAIPIVAVNTAATTGIGSGVPKKDERSRERLAKEDRHTGQHHPPAADEQEGRRQRLSREDRHRRRGGHEQRLE